MQVLFSMTEQEHKQFQEFLCRENNEGVGAFLERLGKEMTTDTGIPVTVAMQFSTPTESSDLDWLFQEADRVQTEFERLRSIGQASMDCPNCGGRGAVSGGSLGDICDECDGSGVVNAPFAEPLELPDMAAFRRTLKSAEETMKLGGKVDLDVLKLQLVAYKVTGQEAAQKVLNAPAEPRRQLRGAPKVGKKRHLLGPLDHPTGIVTSTYDEDSDDGGDD